MQTVGFSACNSRQSAHFGAKPTEDELKQLKGMIGGIPSLGQPFADQLTRSSVSLLHNQVYQKPGFWGIRENLSAVLPALLLAAKVLSGKKPLVQWVQFRTEADAAKAEVREDLPSFLIGKHWIRVWK